MKKFLSVVSSLFGGVRKWFSHLVMWQKIVTIILLCGLVGWIGYTLTKTNSDTTYQFTTVAKTTLKQTVSETGEVVGSNKVAVASTTNGIVKAVSVKNGQPVKRGAVLFTVTATATEAERSKAYADYLSAKNTLAAAQSKQYNLESTMWQSHETFVIKALDQDLAEVDPTFIQTNRDWLAAEANYKNQAQAITAAQSSVTNAALTYQSMTDGTVKATADGVVANLAVAVGQTVKTSDEALTLKTASDNWVKVAISENEIVSVQPNQLAVVTVEAANKAKLTGTVMRVDEFATLVSEVPVYYVYLVLAETKEPIRPGMTAQVEITTQEKQNVLAVPTSALKPYQGAKAVQIFDEKTQTVLYQPVQIGIADDTMTEIVSGLTEGQKIILTTTSTTTTKGTGSVFRAPGG